jgi:hypothetical protein
MARWKRALGAIAVLAVARGLMSCHAMHFMKRAQEFEINSRAADSKVLIATQGSAFKDSIVAGAVAHLKPRGIYVRVIDVSALPSVQEADWNVIVVIHTWEMHRPQADAANFIAKLRDSRKIIVLSTSGAGSLKMEGVDAISSASQMIDVPQRVAEIDARIDAILAAR